MAFCKPVWMAWAMLLAAGYASGSGAAAQGPAAKAKPAAGANHPQASSGAMRLDDWFSFGAPSEKEVEREAPGVKLKVHDPRADDIIVYGHRFKRDFDGAGDTPNLTSPQALDAAQPVIPAMGDSCTYKYGCFDRDQEPLRSSLGSLIGAD